MPYSCASGLVLALMQETASRYPQILLHIHENFEGVLAEELLQGRMDLAFLYELSARPGLLYSPLNTEPLCVVAARATAPALASGRAVDPVALADFPLLLPSRIHAIRQMVEAYFEANQVKPRVLAEIEVAGNAVRGSAGGAGGRDPAGARRPGHRRSARGSWPGRSLARPPS